MMKKDKRIDPLPFPIYFWTIFFLIIAGLANATYLSISHYRVYTDIGYRSFCAISKAINCDTVSQSPYSIFLGLPVPIWGIIGYLFAGGDCLQYLQYHSGNDFHFHHP
jgi:uncharacterized membrane protein